MRKSSTMKWVNGVLTEVRDVEDICQDLVVLVNDLKEDNQQLRDSLEKLKDEKWRDDELIKMRDERDKAIADSHRGFSISEKEMKIVHAWQNDHDAKQHGITSLEERLKFKGAIGGSYSFEFVGTSIGVFGSCVCGTCRNKAIKNCNGSIESFHKLLKQYDAEFTFQEAD